MKVDFQKSLIENYSVLSQSDIIGLTYFEIGNYKESIDSFRRVEIMVPNQSDTYYNLALAYNKISESRMADFYYNRYQDMLSLRKAQERMEEMRKEQEREKKIRLKDLIQINCYQILH